MRTVSAKLDLQHAHQITMQRLDRTEGEIRNRGNVVKEIRSCAVSQVLDVYLFLIYSSVLSNIHHPDVG